MDDRDQSNNADGALNARLAAYREQSSLRLPHVAQAYDRLVARLDSLDRGEVGPAIGDPMPRFLLPDQSGQLVDLEALLESGPAVISFNRGHWCPYCRLDLHALAAIHPDIERLGARVVSIMPDRAQYTKKSIAEHGLRFPVLSDVDLGYSLSIGMVFWVGAEVRELYDQLGLDLASFQGNDSYVLPMAAKFIVGQDGRVKARQVDIEFRQRMEPAAILAALRDLRATA